MSDVLTMFDTIRPRISQLTIFLIIPMLIGDGYTIQQALTINGFLYMNRVKQYSL